MLQWLRDGRVAPNRLFRDFFQHIGDHVDAHENIPVFNIKGWWIEALPHPHVVYGKKDLPLDIHQARFWLVAIATLHHSKDCFAALHMPLSALTTILDGENPNAHWKRPFIEQAFTAPYVSMSAITPAQAVKRNAPADQQKQVLGIKADDHGFVNVLVKLPSLTYAEPRDTPMNRIDEVARLLKEGEVSLYEIPGVAKYSNPRAPGGDVSGAVDLEKQWPTQKDMSNLKMLWPPLRKDLSHGYETWAKRIEKSKKVGPWPCSSPMSVGPCWVCHCLLFDSMSVSGPPAPVGVGPQFFQAELFVYANPDVRRGTKERAWLGCTLLVTNVSYQQSRVERGCTLCVIFE